IQGKKSIKILFEAPYGVLLFSFGLYMVVFALHKIGVSEILVKSYTFLMQDKSGIFGVALISAFGSSVFNNLPMVLIGDLALKEYFENFSFDSLMIYAHLLGVNIGPKLTPIGSLATLLWLGVLARKGINISFWQYCKFGFLITLPVLVFSLFALIV
ncbi:ArsB/NhaD family transporter, partial [Campylobacter jejuni]